jgi:DNA-binding IclR family transcriptional regulator
MPDQAHDARFRCVLKAMMDAGAQSRRGLTAAEIADACGLPMHEALATCRSAVAEGYAQRVGFKTDGPTYALTPKGVVAGRGLRERSGCSGETSGR